MLLKKVKGEANQSSDDFKRIKKKGKLTDRVDLGRKTRDPLWNFLFGR